MQLASYSTRGLSQLVAPKMHSKQKTKFDPFFSNYDTTSKNISRRSHSTLKGFSLVVYGYLRPEICFINLKVNFKDWIQNIENKQQI